MLLFVFRSNHELSLAYRNGLFDLNQTTKREDTLLEGLRQAEAAVEGISLQKTCFAS